MAERIRTVELLPDSLISKIAAGEVVQRPASVVKELVENSIDAGASKIIVVIKNAGKTMIQVSDNGEGMTEDDLVLAIERHATSKIKTYEDLEGVTTLGFRGEALPSISSVSRFEIRTARKDSSEGSSIRIEGGKIRSVTPVPATEGTRVTVRNLFFNTPARRKFLKSTQVEYRHILEAVKRFALGFPEIVFEFYNDKKQVFAAPEGDLLARIGRTFSKSYPEKLKRVEGQGTSVRVDGYVGGVNLVRRTRGEQYLFLNKRYISDRKMSSAVFKAYGGLIDRGEFPFFVLNLRMNPSQADVNVHPAKMEVKFRSEWDVYETLKSSVQKVIHPAGAMSEHYVPDSGGGRAHPPQPPRHSQKIIPFSPGKRAERIIPPRAHMPVRSDEVTEKGTGFTRANEAYQSAFPDDGIEPEYVEGEVWQIHNKYLVSQVKSGIVIIDQHVAHERILYELALKSIEKGSGNSQQLLFPQTIDLSPEDHSVLLEILSFLNSIGFEIHEFGARTIVLQAVPADIRAGSEGRVLKQILDNYRDTSSKEVPAHRTLAASYACKAAIKAGERLNSDEMMSLVDRLFATEYPYFCPHGRPVLVNMTIDELDKRFDRK